MKITAAQLRRIIREELTSSHLSNPISEEHGMEVDFADELILGGEHGDLDPEHDHAIYGRGGKARMARSQLYRIAKFAQSLYDRLDDQDELPEWLQSKVAQVADSMDAVHGHLDHKMAQRGAPIVEED